MPTTSKLEQLPNETFLDVFEYLLAPDLFKAFDRLNYRFSALIRHVPLHLNFEQVQKSAFDGFCESLLANPQIKPNGTSLRLSNRDTRGQIQSFVSLFNLAEFIHLRSLSLAHIDDTTARLVLPILPVLSTLVHLSCTQPLGKIIIILPAIAGTHIRALTTTSAVCPSTFIDQRIALSSLSLSLCDITQLQPVLTCTPMLKYLQIDRFFGRDENHKHSMLDLHPVDLVHLKQLTIADAALYFDDLRRLLRRLSNLQILSIYSKVTLPRIDADRWQELIETSLVHLRTFHFYFHAPGIIEQSGMLAEFRKFQTHFWHQQHAWYTNFEINDDGAAIYTIPYTWHTYTLTSARCRFHHPSMSYLKVFEQVKQLSLHPEGIEDQAECYFPSVRSLIFKNRDDRFSEIELTAKQLECLPAIVNLSRITELMIGEGCVLTESSLRDLLSNMPNLSSFNMLEPLRK